jgi:hypothetical protein
MQAKEQMANHSDGYFDWGTLSFTDESEPTFSVVQNSDDEN